MVKKLILIGLCLVFFVACGHMLEDKAESLEVITLSQEDHLRVTDIEDGAAGGREEEKLSEKPSMNTNEFIKENVKESKDTDGQEDQNDLSKRDDSFDLSKEGHDIDRMMSTMSLEEIVGQLFIVERDPYLMDGIPYGGVIYFKKDFIGGYDQVFAEIKELKAVATLLPFVAIDEEGGIVTRISKEGGLGGTIQKSPWDQYHDGGLTEVIQATTTILEEIEGLGFNLNFAPVGDVFTNPNNKIIGKRAYSDKAEDVAEVISAILSVYKTYPILPCVKHFPGHGDTQGDSHIEPVFVSGTQEELMEREWLPFQAAIESNVPMLMVGHIQLPDMTEDKSPASLNPEILTHILRNQLDYKGLVISDALNMQAITGYYSHEDIIEKGLLGGLDLLLMPAEPQKLYDMIISRCRVDEDFKVLVYNKVRRIIVNKKSMSS